MKKEADCGLVMYPKHYNQQSLYNFVAMEYQNLILEV